MDDIYKKLITSHIKRGLGAECSKFVLASNSLKAVVLRGTAIGHDDMFDLANKFYIDIAAYLEHHGFTVYFDFGDNETPPLEGDLWIAHCIATNRFKWAHKDTKLLALDAAPLHMKNVVYVNHPTDVSSKIRGEHSPDKYHYIFTDKMKTAIDFLTFQILKNKL